MHARSRSLVVPSQWDRNGGRPSQSSPVDDQAQAQARDEAERPKNRIWTRSGASSCQALHPLCCAGKSVFLYDLTCPNHEVLCGIRGRSNHDVDKAVKVQTKSTHWRLHGRVQDPGPKLTRTEARSAMGQTDVTRVSDNHFVGHPRAVWTRREVWESCGKVHSGPFGIELDRREQSASCRR